MRLILATNHLGLGGSESYLLTVAEQLDRLGHEVVVFTPDPGGGVEVAEARGIEVAGGGTPEGDFDAALVQDGAVAHELAESCPSVPQVFVAHSSKFDLQTPPQLADAVEVVVALNDRVAARMRSCATEVEVVRLSQPIDTEHFTPRGPLPDVPRRALLLSNNSNRDRLEMIDGACAEAGLELVRVGGHAGGTTDVRSALTGAEIVIGYGRSVLEAMACGRAAYVYDWKGGDGWVTAESYAAIEADGFAGGANGTVLDREGMAVDLRAYSAAMGPVNHDLVIKRHKAAEHAQELVDLLRGLARKGERQRDSGQEMARLVRLEWRARVEINTLTDENTHLRRLLDTSERERKKALEAAAKEQRRAEVTASEYEATTSWRLTRPLRGLGSLLRRRGR